MTKEYEETKEDKWEEETEEEIKKHKSDEKADIFDPLGVIKTDTSGIEPKIRIRSKRLSDFDRELPRRPQEVQETKENQEGEVKKSLSFSNILKENLSFVLFATFIIIILVVIFMLL